MSKPTDQSPRFTAMRLLLASLPLLFVAACSSTSSKVAAEKRHDAAAYNVQLGIAYMNQGDLERAKDKLDRALALCTSALSGSWVTARSSLSLARSRSPWFM